MHKDISSKEEVKSVLRSTSKRKVLDQAELNKEGRLSHGNALMDHAVGVWEDPLS